MTIRAVLFDLDGTLVDSLADIGESMNQALAEAGLSTHDLPAYRGFVGWGARGLVERAAPKGEEARLDELLAAFLRCYAGRLTKRTALYPGVAELLDGLSARGLPFAVCSNKPQAMTEEVVAALLDRWGFVGVEGQREGRPRKPDPASAHGLAKVLGLPPAEIAFVGDTKTDMQTAVNAGMRAVGVLWGFRDRAELEAHGAQVVVESPADLAAWLAEG